MFLKTLLVVTMSLIFVSHDDSKKDKKSTNDLGHWKKDPVCRAVYDGVLKGLKKDNVSLQVVDNIIGKSSSKASRTERMRRSFVLDCPLCEPTFEAFLAYQTATNKKSGAPALSNRKSKKAGLNPKEIESLSSENTMVRLQGLAPVVKRWIQSEFESNSQLKGSEISKWKTRVNMRFNEGKSHLVSLMVNDKHYKDWSAYWGCAACNGSRDAAIDWKK